ncbi:Hint domain-containing protein [Fuscovulum blasticum]|uniref:Hint domain-containing protein n=1 Tax=Fuscovulum blasticum TaxID=1075 RepID=UPI000D3E421F|nr:Hint domain-containing protein [Fuscovulum blasticum]AWD21863.1 hypothetical protein B6K69_09365 [Fuscovulum blasticum]
MAVEIVDPGSTELIHLASVDVKFSGAHIGGGIYFSANHNPTPGGTNTAIPQRSLDGQAEQHATTEYDYTLPFGGAPWDAYREDTDNNGTLDYVKAGFDMSLHVGARLSSTGQFYDGPAVPLLIANDPNDLFGTVTITGYPSAANSLNGLGGVLHQTTGTLAAGQSIYTGENAYVEQDVGGDIGGYFTIDDAEALGGMSGGGTFLDYDADGDGVTETYLIGAVARGGVAFDENGQIVGTFVQSASFSPHYADLAATIQSLTGDDARTADDFPRMTLLSAQTAGSTLTTVQGQFFHEDIYGGVNDDALYGGGGDDRIFGGAGADLVSGGAGNDTLTGGADADWFAADSFASGGNDVIADFDGAGGDVIDLGSYFQTLDDVVAATTETPDGSILITLPMSAGGGTVQVLNTSIADLNAVNLNVICFAAGTLILTAQGEVPVEDLVPGDEIITRSGASRCLKAVNTRVLGDLELTLRPNLWPVVIARNALGPDVPSRNLRVSPQHRVLVNSRIAHRVGHGDVLVSAKSLLGVPGITQSRPETGCTYVHLVFDRHEVIKSDGCWSESLFPGAQVFLSLPRSLREEYEEIFGNPAGHRPAATIFKGHKARALIRRHLRNGVALQTAAPQTARCQGQAGARA